MARASLPVKINSMQLLQRSTSVVPMLRGRCRHAARGGGGGSGGGPRRPTKQQHHAPPPRRVLRVHVPHRALPGAGRSPFTPATSRQGARRRAPAHRTLDPPPLTTDSTVALGSRAGDEPVHTCTHTHSIDTHTHARPLSRHVRVHASHVKAHDMRVRSGARVAWTVTCGTGGLTSRHGWIEGLAVDTCQ